MRPTPIEAAALTRLRAAFNDACNYVSGVAWDAQEFNSVRLHRLAYYDVRATYGLLAQHAVRVIGVVANSYRADKKRQHTFKATAAVVLDTPRLYRIEHNRAGIATLDGRIKVELNIGGIQRKQLTDAVKLAEADLVQDHKGRWRLLVSAHYIDPPMMGTEGVLGIDLGRTDIAVTSEGDTFSGAHVTAVRLVNPAYTSQMCHCCLHVGERSGKRFVCINPACRWSGDADYNGALNIALLGASVTCPGGPALCCSYQPDARAAESPCL